MSKGKNSVPFLLIAAGVLYAVWPIDIPGPVDDALVLFVTTLLSVLIKTFTSRFGVRMDDRACNEFAERAVNAVVTPKTDESSITLPDKEEPDNKHVSKASAFR